MLRLVWIVAIAAALSIGLGIPAYQHNWWGIHPPAIPEGSYAADQTPPSVATPPGAPATQAASNGPLAGSHIKVTDPQGKVLIDQAISDKFLERDPQGHISPGLIPAFYYRSGFSELPLAGQPAGTWVVAGHSGANQAFTPLVGLQGKDPATLGQYLVTITSPLGAEQDRITNVVPVDKQNVTSKYGDNLAGRRLLVACQLNEQGQPIDMNVVVELAPFAPA